MESLGIFLHASFSCIVVFTFFSGTASENIVNEILQRLEKVEELNFELKKQNSELKLEMTYIKSENIELKHTVDEMKVWMKSGKFQVNNYMVESNSNLKKENLKIKLEMAELREQMDDIRRVNRDLKETVNELKGWVKFKQFPEIKKSKSQIHIKEEHLPRIPYNQANESRKDNSIRSVKRLSEFLFLFCFLLYVIFLSERVIILCYILVIEAPCIRYTVSCKCMKTRRKL